MICLALNAADSFAQSSAYAEKSRPAQFDFESVPTDSGWRTYDLDGKSTFIFGKPMAWYWTFEDGSENGVCGATSLFNYSYDESNFVTPVTVPANDWLFSPAFSVPASGSFMLEWDARSAHSLYFEDYEIRVIDADLLESLEASFNSSMTLAEVSEKMIENSEPIYKVLQEKPVWTSHSISINKYRGQKVSFIWRYISNHSSMLYIDHYRVVEQSDRTFDVAAGVPDVPYSYTTVPEFMARVQTGFDMTVLNVSDDEQSSVSSKVEMTDMQGNEIMKLDLQSESLDAGATAGFAETLSSEDALKLISEPYTMSITTTSETGFTDICRYEKTSSREVTETTLAWVTDGESSCSIPSHSAVKKIGQRFPVWTDSELQSVSFRLGDKTSVTKTSVSVYEEIGDGFELKGESSLVSVTPGERQVCTAEFSKRIVLDAGKTYLVAVSEESDKMLDIVYSATDHGRIAAEFTSADNHWVERGNGVTLAIWLDLAERESSVESVAQQDPNQIHVDSNGVLHLNGEGRYTIVNAYGSVVATGEAVGESTEVRLSLPRGFYVVSFNDASRKVML